MRRLLTTGLSGILLLAALTASTWTLLLSDTSRQNPPAQPVQNSPDAWMENVSATVVNTAGIPAMHIESPFMTHYPRNDTTLIQKPEITLYRKSSGPWHVRADKGIAARGIEHLLLKKNVVVHHPGDKTDPEMMLRTESLTVFPEREEVETPEAVTITQPNAIIRAVGMNANFSTGTVHLLSDTRSEYVPAS